MSLKKRVIAAAVMTAMLIVSCAFGQSPKLRSEAGSDPGDAIIASGACGDADSSLTWSLSGDGVLTISGSGRMKDYSHPQKAPQSSFDDWQLWDSAPWLYYDLCAGADGQPLCRIRQVNFGEGITYIGEYAFTYSHIQSVTLPEGLAEIGAGAFGSSELTSVTLPSTLTTVGGGAFTGCNIMSVTIPEGVAVVRSGAFGNGGCSATTGAQNMIIFRQITEVTILSGDCAIEDSGREHNTDNYVGWDNIYTIGDPSYTVIRGYPGSTAEAFAQKWGYTFRSLDDAPAQATGKKLLKVQSYGQFGYFYGETSYEYNDEGLLVRSVYQTYGDSPWEAVYTYTYDGEGRLLNKHQSSDEGEYETDVFVRSYNDDGTLASSSYSGYSDIWTTEEYFYDENGLVVREKHTIFPGDTEGSSFYSFENSVDEQGNLTAIRHDEDYPESEGVAFIYDPDGRMLQGFDDYWGAPITYTDVDDPYFCVRDEVETVDYWGSGQTDTWHRRVAYILDSAGKEVESFDLGTVGEMELTYDEEGNLSSVKYLDSYLLSETRFIYGDPAEAAAGAPTENGGAQAGSVTLTVTGDQVNIRTGPGTDYEAIGQVSSGDTLVMTGKSDNWYQVEYNGGTAYIIQDYVIENSAPAAAAADEASVNATLEGDWSGFIGSLAAQYGVMSTTEISMPEDWSSPTVWTGSDVTGLLSATVLDLDNDGQQELFTVRMDYFSDGGTDNDHTHLYLAVYEPGSGTPAAERVFFPGAEIVGANLGALCQFTVFTYDYNGVRYICLDDYTTMNETWTVVNFFSYDGSQLVFEGAGNYEEYGSGDVYVYRADTEPAAFQGFTQHLYNDSGNWQTVMAFSMEDADWHALEPGEEQAYFKAYTDILAEYGLIADHDERIWINQTDDDRFAYCTLTAPDVYTVAEGELRPLAQAGRFYEYDSEGNMLFVLHRTDCEGTLDSYR